MDDQDVKLLFSLFLLQKMVEKISRTQHLLDQTDVPVVEQSFWSFMKLTEAKLENIFHLWLIFFQTFQTEVQQQLLMSFPLGVVLTHT